MRRAILDRSERKTAESAWQMPERLQPASQPDALGIATRQAAARLRAERITLEPLLRSAGLTGSQIHAKGARIGVASQVRFLELAAEALKAPSLGFKLARDVDLRQMGLLYYVAASSETLGDALDRMQRYSQIANAGVALRCIKDGNFTIALSYVGVARHADRQQMEFLVTALVRFCRTLTHRHLSPSAVHLVHRGSDQPSEFEKFLGCRIEFGADADKIVFEKKAAQLHVVGADPYLNELLLQYCKQALAHRRSNFNSLRTTVENTITTLLPHGTARHVVVAEKLGMSSRTLARRLTAEGLNFGEILDRLRSDLTTRYLSEEKLSISQIAWMLGYSGVSAFSHGCKRWTGMSPKKIRDKLLSGRKRSLHQDSRPAYR